MQKESACTVYCVPIDPMNCTLIPVCSRRFPSFGRTVTAPLTDSPSMYRGAFSLRPLSSLTSTVCRSSLSSSTTSMSTGVEKNKDAMLVNQPHLKRSSMKSTQFNSLISLDNGNQRAWVMSRGSFIARFTTAWKVAPRKLASGVQCGLCNRYRTTKRSCSRRT